MCVCPGSSRLGFDVAQVADVTVRTQHRSGGMPQQSLFVSVGVDTCGVCQPFQTFLEA